ncbi:MAG: penicillin-binding protein, partial [Rubricoccaceae bacterium]
RRTLRAARCAPHAARRTLRAGLPGPILGLHHAPMSAAPPDAYLTRLYVVTVAVLVLPALVAAQMVRIHLAEGAELRALGERQASSYIELPAQRGAIYDQAGRALVVNTARYEVAADPTMPGFAERAEELYALLGTLTGRGAAHFRARVRGRASRQYVLLVRNLDEPSRDRLVAENFPGLLITGSFARRYTYGSLAAHVIGHVDRDLAGGAGLEQHFEAHLAGTPGRQAVQRDRRGRVRALVGGSVVPPRHGGDLVLTIDLVRQALMEEELARGVAAAGAAWGTAIAMDVRTGAILALANAPTYDPNRPGEGPVSAQRNHAVSDRIEPGSTFKLVTAIAAVEHGVLSPDDTVDTGRGIAHFHGRAMRDSRGYGRIPFRQAIAVSSNIAMARAAEAVGDQAFYRTARALGFGQPTYVDLPGEVPGTLHPPETWGRLTLPWMSTGYAVEATPLQILAAYAALANGGLLVQPYVVAERRDAEGRTVWRARQDSIRRAFSPETAAALLPAFEESLARGGTAQRAVVEGLRIAGKTGTAQKASRGGYRRAYRASFAGVFPADAPEVALLVILDEPTNGYYGGAVAAPIFASIARRWVGTFPSIAARVAPSAPFPQRDAAPVPDVAGWPGVLAAARLRAEGFAVRLARGAGWAPVDRPAEPHAALPLAAPVRLAPRPSESRGSRAGGAPAGGAARVMPDVRGLGTRQAVAWLRSVGVEPRLEGRGVVERQLPAPGTALPRTGRVDALVVARLDAPPREATRLGLPAPPDEAAAEETP